MNAHTPFAMVIILSFLAGIGAAHAEDATASSAGLEGLDITLKVCSETAIVAGNIVKHDDKIGEDMQILLDSELQIEYQIERVLGYPYGRVYSLEELLFDPGLETALGEARLPDLLQKRVDLDKRWLDLDEELLELVQKNTNGTLTAEDKEQTRQILQSREEFAREEEMLFLEELLLYLEYAQEQLETKRAALEEKRLAGTLTEDEMSSLYQMDLKREHFLLEEELFVLMMKDLKGALTAEERPRLDQLRIELGQTNLFEL